MSDAQLKVETVWQSMVESIKKNTKTEMEKYCNQLEKSRKDFIDLKKENTQFYKELQSLKKTNEDFRNNAQKFKEKENEFLLLQNYFVVLTKEKNDYFNQLKNKESELIKSTGIIDVYQKEMLKYKGDLEMLNNINLKHTENEKNLKAKIAQELSLKKKEITEWMIKFENQSKITEILNNKLEETSIVVSLCEKKIKEKEKINQNITRDFISQIKQKDDNLKKIKEDYENFKQKAKEDLDVLLNNNNVLKSENQVLIAKMQKENQMKILNDDNDTHKKNYNLLIESYKELYKIKLNFQEDLKKKKKAIHKKDKIIKRKTIKIIEITKKALNDHIDLKELNRDHVKTIKHLNKEKEDLIAKNQKLRLDAEEEIKTKKGIIKEKENDLASEKKKFHQELDEIFIEKANLKKTIETHLKCIEKLKKEKEDYLKTTEETALNYKKKINQLENKIEESKNGKKVIQNPVIDYAIIEEMKYLKSQNFVDHSSIQEVVLKKSEELEKENKQLKENLEKLERKNLAITNEFDMFKQKNIQLKEFFNNLKI